MVLRCWELGSSVWILGCARVWGFHVKVVRFLLSRYWVLNVWNPVGTPNVDKREKQG